jgi:hypothetical protein
MTDEKDRSAPMIGQFSGPPGNSPRVALRRKDEPEGPNTPDEETTQEASEEQKSQKPKSPGEVQKEFMEGLKEVGLDIEAARAIMDSVLEKGHCIEVHTLRGKEIVVRSRGYRDTLRAQRFLEVENPTYATSMDEIIMRYNSAASLVRYADKEFDHPEDREETSDQDIEKAFDRRLRFVETLPSIMVGKLNTVVYNMDVKLAAVFAEGAPEDF